VVSPPPGSSPHYPWRSTAPAQLPTKPWRPSEPSSVGPWGARAAGHVLRASRPRDRERWRSGPAEPHARTAGPGPDPPVGMTGKPDQHRGAGGCDMWSSTSRHRAESSGTAGRKHDKNAVSQAFDTPSHAVIEGQVRHGESRAIEINALFQSLNRSRSRALPQESLDSAPSSEV
jgi:hypothetical protein